MGSGKAPRLRLLHISDIHFREPQCLRPELDCDYAIREAVLRDAGEMAERHGSVDAILLSGDIAFKGNEQEYEESLKWLYRLAEVVGCSHQSILPVPGNHDVNRNAIRGTLKGARELILKQQHPAVRNEEFRKSFDDDTGPSFFTPIEEYNKFAARFRCDIAAPHRPFWVRQINFSDEWVLKIHGLTTTFFSGPEDDERGSLLLGSFQTAFYAEDGVIRLAMMHHPPDWLQDGDEVDDKLWAWCSVQLVGHKHTDRIRRDARGIRLAAAAVNPDRKEPNWAPGYNFIELEVKPDGDKHVLLTRSHLRKWQVEPPRFFSMFDEEGNSFFDHPIKIGVRKGPKPAVKLSGDALNVPDSTAITTAVEEVVPMPTPDGDDVSDPVFLFWELDAADRLDIVEDLQLLTEADNNLSEVLRYRKAFEKAAELKLEQKLVEAIRKRAEERGDKR